MGGSTRSFHSHPFLNSAFAPRRQYKTTSLGYNWYILAEGSQKIWRSAITIFLAQLLFHAHARFAKIDLKTFNNASPRVATTSYRTRNSCVNYIARRQVVSSFDVITVTKTYRYIIHICITIV